MIEALVIVGVAIVSLLIGVTIGERRMLKVVEEELSVPTYTEKYQVDELEPVGSVRSKRVSDGSELDKVNQDYVDVIAPLYEYDENGVAIGYRKV